MKTIKKWLIYLFARGSEIDKALAIVKSTKEEDWTMAETSNEKGQFCFIGHLYNAKNPFKEIPGTTSCKRDKFVGSIDNKLSYFMWDKHGVSAHSYTVNDKKDINGYTEATPRARILHLLEDAKKAGL